MSLSESVRLGVALGITMTASACSPAPPEFVWVPGPDFAATLEIHVDLPESRELRVGEHLRLHAQRSTGPWTRVEYSSLSNGDCWIVQPPPAIEAEVQSNVKWSVTPAAHAKFNLPGAASLTERTVSFDSPGTYRLSATSHVWCGDLVQSDAVELAVEP